MTRRVLELLGPSTGGIRRHVAALAEHLPASGWYAETAGPLGVMDGLLDDTAVLDVPGSFADLARRPDRLVTSTRRLRTLAGPVEVVHADGLKAGLIAVVARTSRPVVLTLHNVVLDEVAGRGAAALRHVERAVITRADRVICGSADIEAMFAGVVPPERLRWIIPAAPDPVVRRERSVVRDQLGVGGSDPLIVAPAWLHAQKNLPLLISAFCRIVDHHPTARLVILGEGPLRAALQSLIDQRGMSERITLAGRREDPADEMAAADIVALSSSWEGVPLAAVEALQLGRPLVMTAVGTVGTDLARDGVGGIAVGIDDVTGFAAALDSLLRDPELARRTGDAGKVLGERYRAGRLVAEVAELYDDVTARTRGVA